jgi:hypothetical protein
MVLRARGWGSCLILCTSRPGFLRCAVLMRCFRLALPRNVLMMVYVTYQGSRQTRFDRTYYVNRHLQSPTRSNSGCIYFSVATEVINPKLFASPKGGKMLPY